MTYLCGYLMPRGPRSPLEPAKLRAQASRTKGCRRSPRGPSQPGPKSRTAAPHVRGSESEAQRGNGGGSRAAGGQEGVTAEPRTGPTSGARRFRARGGAGAGVGAAPSGHSPGRAGGRRGGDQAAPPRAAPAPAPGCRCPPWPMSSAPLRSPLLRPPKMKKDESFLGKLGGTLARKKKAREGECAGRRPPADPIPAGTARPRASPRARARPRGPPGPRGVARSRDLQDGP